MNSINPPRGVPEICGDIFRLRLASGSIYEFSCFDVRGVQPTLSCCGAPPNAMLCLHSDREYQTDHDYSAIKSLWDSWHDGRPRPAA